MLGHNQAQIAAAEAASAGHPLQAQESSNQALFALRAAQSELRSAMDLLGVSANRRPHPGTTDSLPLETTDLPAALQNHYSRTDLGPGNHESYLAFNMSWTAMLSDLARQIPVSLRVIKVRDLPITLLPLIPPDELQSLALGTVTAKPIFIAPDLPQA